MIVIDSSGRWFCVRVGGTSVWAGLQGGELIWGTKLSSGTVKLRQWTKCQRSASIVCLRVKLMSNLSKHIVDLSINYLYTPGRTEQAQRLVIVYLQNMNDEKMKYLLKLDIHWNLLVQFIIEFQTKLDRITIYFKFDFGGRCSFLSLLYDSYKSIKKIIVRILYIIIIIKMVLIMMMVAMI